MSTEHTPMTQERLDAIQARVDTATKGPWMEGTRCVFTEDYEHAIVSDSLVEVPGMTPYGEAVQNPADVALIAHAPEDLADLLAEVERLRQFESIVSWQWGDTTDGRTREDMVERAAMVMCTRTTHPGARHGWGWATPAAKDAWREDARAVLDAALDNTEEA